MSIHTSIETGLAHAVFQVEGISIILRDYLNHMMDPVDSVPERSDRDMVKSCVWGSGGFLGDLDAVLEGDSSDDVG